MTFDSYLCCGYKTLPACHPFEICPVCYCEDDWLQRDVPDYEGGANTESLEQAQRYSKTFGASGPTCRRPRFDALVALPFACRGERAAAL
jgi:hypothetical protein